MAQYFKVKEQYADCLLFYRMGDFYELFFDDAAQASQILDIALTKRGKHGDAPIPMCGVPVHAAEMYLQKLIASGLKIAICEQMETPAEAKKRGHKEVVRREVVRVVTPGTITEEALLPRDQSQYLCALAVQGNYGAAAWLELSTGEFLTSHVPLAALPSLLARIAPRELLITQTTYETLAGTAWFHEWRDRAAIRPDIQFDMKKAARVLAGHYAVANANVFGSFTPLETSVLGGLLEYVQLTQLQALPRIDLPRQESQDTALQMDAATRRNLELVCTLQGERKGSLLACIDSTVTAPGSRLLANWLAAPSRLRDIIHARQDAIAWAQQNHPLREQLRVFLKSVPDMERAVGRLSLGRGGPRDLQLLGAGLNQSIGLNDLLPPLKLPALLSELREDLVGHHALAEHLGRALMQEVPVYKQDGNFIASDYRDDLAEWRSLRDESKRILAVMEQQLKKETDIGSLKIKHNNVLGYFIEITQIHEKKVPLHFIHRQGLAGALRYTTPELNETARKIEEAADRALKLELMIFDELLSEVMKASEAIIRTARALAKLDVITALAERAVADDWIRPTITPDGEFMVEQGRHPVVEASLKRQHQDFMPNDCAMGEDARLWLITGPNMGGKSTFLRQQAILIILAQTGSFVPAKSATIGIADKLFCRVGAADDLARGQSTFMVEMVETASILHQASEKSFVVLDEIGRGTATYDGVSIAWAVAEYLHNKTQCRALFATHYHELTALAETSPKLKNYHLAVKEHGGQVIFLHQVREGYADKSYGLHVAALAGMPKPVLTRAKTLLATLESGHSLTEKTTANQLPLFASTALLETVPEPAINRLAERLENTDPNHLTPMEALTLLHELKALSES